ncbi:uncharacterized protein ANIA_11591 [Aspergillus nidulans FGSC A4]|uniref:Uncharacterized protein n=1 Tax=Emericella nidulans (strain FGSC A4 / ATCC 38163 / CBS 112.46 / NRRL 194 / M139) TaxID=227321 RepID=C8V6W9_EMENI|nr:hypothetical protein [Aspergillus nidulans FGSC A4]CBF74002.1 TPA: hypothetical protein ANIA_11591 [Aspergillus nidulans FGSC A4]
MSSFILSAFSLPCCKPSSTDSSNIKICIYKGFS